MTGPHESPRGARRGGVTFAVAVAAIVAAVGVAYMYILEPAPPPPTVQPPAAPAAPEARLQRADGTVQIRLRDTEAWRTATVGEVIAPGADVRTGTDGAALVAYGEGVSAQVQSESLIRLDEMRGALTRLIVGEGLVVIDVDENVAQPRRVQVAAQGSDAVVETHGGRITMLNDGEGRVQTAVTRGQATLSAQGESVRLGSGQQSSVAPGQAPSAPAAIPPSLLLKVQWPQRETAKRSQVISGTTNPGSRVRVGQQVVTADSRGRFEAVVALKEGRNRIKVQVVDVVGRSQGTESPDITLDTQAPSLAVETDPNIWKRRDR